MGYLANLREKVGHMPLVAAFSVMIVLSKDKKILLEKREDDGYWDIPGGSIELYESAEEAASRELYEETHLKALSFSLFGVYSGKIAYYQYANGDVVSGVDIVYLCENYEGTLLPQKEEVKELRYFDLSAVPSLMSIRNKQILSDLKKFILKP